MRSEQIRLDVARGGCRSWLCLVSWRWVLCTFGLCSSLPSSPDLTALPEPPAFCTLGSEASGPWNSTNECLLKTLSASLSHGLLVLWLLGVISGACSYTKINSNSKTLAVSKWHCLPIMFYPKMQIHANCELHFPKSLVKYSCFRAMLKNQQATRHIIYYTLLSSASTKEVRKLGEKPWSNLKFGQCTVQFACLGRMKTWDNSAWN